MEINTRFGMDFNPFIKNSKDVFVESRDFKETIARLNYLKDIKGFGIITGSPGTGKTTALRYWKNTLNKSLFKVVYTCLSTLTVNEFIRNLTEELNVESHYKKAANIHAIQDEVNRLSIEKHITPVFMIDEADHALTGVLNDLKLIFNFDMDSKDRAIVILTGLPNLTNTLNYKSNESLRQRIIMNYRTEGLSKDESKMFVTEKLKATNTSKEIFNENALEAIANAANGSPRMLNKYCNNSLNFANVMNLDYVDGEIAMKAIEDCTIN